MEYLIENWRIPVLIVGDIVVITVCIWAFREFLKISSEVEE